jgi:hypothetical protein
MGMTVTAVVSHQLTLFNLSFCWHFEVIKSSCCLNHQKFSPSHYSFWKSNLFSAFLSSQFFIKIYG